MALTNWSHWQRERHWLNGIMQAYRVTYWEVVKDAVTWKDELRWVDASGEKQSMTIPHFDARFDDNFLTLLHMRMRLTQGEMVPQ